MEFGHDMPMPLYRKACKQLPEEVFRQIVFHLFPVDEYATHRLKRARAERPPESSFPWGSPSRTYRAYVPAPSPHEFAWMLRMDEAQLYEENDESRWIAQRGKDECLIEIQLLARLSGLPMDATKQEVEEAVGWHGNCNRTQKPGLEVNMLPSLAWKVGTTILHEFLLQIAEHVGDSDILYKPDFGTHGYFPRGFAHHTRRYLLAIDCEVAGMDNQRYIHDMADERWGPVLPAKDVNKDAQITAWRRAMFQGALPLFRVMAGSNRFTPQFVQLVEGTAALRGLA